MHFFVVAGLDPAIHATQRLAAFRGYPAQGRASRSGSELNHLNASEHQVIACVCRIPVEGPKAGTLDSLMQWQLLSLEGVSDILFP